LNQLKNQPNKIDYASFGGTPEVEEVERSPLVEVLEPRKAEAPKQQKVDYSTFGGEPEKAAQNNTVQPVEKEKVGPFWSALYGAAETALGIPIACITPVATAV